jgi:hypothetical protein
MNYATSRAVIRREESLSSRLGEPISRRRYLIVSSLLAHPKASIWEAVEEVATSTLAHPEWDMEETKTWAWWNLPRVR